jgi:hypothetical protein
MTTRQSGTAVLFSSPKLNGSMSFGTTEQELRFGGVSSQEALGMQPDTKLYLRGVAVVNGSVTRDDQRLMGENISGSERKNVGSDEVMVQKHCSAGTWPRIGSAKSQSGI